MLLHALSILLLTLCQARLIQLPPGVQVEGVTHAAGSNYFVSDVRSAAIFLVDIQSGLVTSPIPTSPNRTALGLYASRGRLFIARGGATGFGSGPGPSRPSLDVNHIATGALLASCPVDEGAIVNDVVADRRFAFYTDSLLGVVYKLRLAAVGACHIEKIRMPPPFFSDTDTPLLAANGLVKYKKGLIVAHFELGTLFFIDLLNGNKAQQLLPSGSLPGPDGLEIHRRKGGSRLYVTQPTEDHVSEWKLSIDDRRVSINFVRNITSPDFEVPTTAARFGNTLVVANSRFFAFPPNETVPTGFRTSVNVLHL